MGKKNSRSLAKKADRVARLRKRKDEAETAGMAKLKEAAICSKQIRAIVGGHGDEEIPDLRLVSLDGERSVYKRRSPSFFTTGPED